MCGFAGAKVHLQNGAILRAHLPLVGGMQHGSNMAGDEFSRTDSAALPWNQPSYKRILDLDNEGKHAIFVSHSRRDPAALNAACESTPVTSLCD